MPEDEKKVGEKKKNRGSKGSQPIFGDRCGAGAFRMQGRGREAAAVFQGTFVWSYLYVQQQSFF